MWFSRKNSFFPVLHLYQILSETSWLRLSAFRGRQNIFCNCFALHCLACSGSLLCVCLRLVSSIFFGFQECAGLRMFFSGSCALCLCCFELLWFPLAKYHVIYPLTGLCLHLKATTYARTILLLPKDLNSQLIVNRHWYNHWNTRPPSLQKVATRCLVL